MDVVSVLGGIDIYGVLTMDLGPVLNNHTINRQITKYQATQKICTTVKHAYNKVKSMDNFDSL